MESSSSGARARGVGAVARGDGPNRRRGLWWLLAGLILLAAIAAVLIAVLSGGSHHAKKASPHGLAPAGAGSVSTPAAAAPAPAVSQTATTTSGPTSAGAGIGQVGGGGTTARPATGRLAPTGSVGAVLFSEDGIALDANARRVVRTAVKEIRSDHDRSVTVVGYTDGIGNAKTNHTLSLERAHAVAAAIRAQLKSSTTRFFVNARGQTDPAAPNTTPPGRQLNRRVEIFAKG